MVNYTGEKKDLRYAYLLECLHTTRFGADAYAAILSTPEQAVQYIESIKVDCDFGIEDDEAESMESKIHKIVLDVNALEPCNDTDDTNNYIKFADKADLKDGISCFVKRNFYTKKEYATNFE